MWYLTIVFVAFLAISRDLAGQSLKQTFSHVGVGYAVQNNTIPPVSASCSITSASQVSSVVSSCTTISVGSFTVSSSQQPLIFNLKSGTIIYFTGEIQFSQHAFSGYLIEIIGSNVKVIGSSTHLFHGHGELYWDGKGGAGSTKPTFMFLKGTSGSSFSGFTLKNCPERCVAIDGSNNITVSGFLIDNREGAPGTAASGKEGHNTDGFDISKSQLVTLSNNIVYNQDDCVAINSGAHMIIDTVNCDGSHGFDIAAGLSISDRTQNVVNNITFRNSQLYNGTYGLHILTVSDGGTGYVNNITYRNITFNGPSDYGIMIQQDFSNSGQRSTGTPVGNVPISNVSFNHITGTMNGRFSRALSIRCAANACSGITLTDVTISNAKSPNECRNYTISGWC